MRKYSIGISIAGVLLLLMAPMLGSYLAGFYLRLTDGMETSTFLCVSEGCIRSIQLLGGLIAAYAVWQFFCISFEKNLPVFFDITKADAKFIMAKAKRKYKEIIGNLPAFEKGDRFQMNIVGCAMLAAVVLSMPERPDVETLTVYKVRHLHPDAGTGTI